MNKDTTFGEKYDPIFKFTTKVEAQEYFEKCVQHTMSFGNAREEAETIERTNIAYYAGYGSHEDRLRVEWLFDCAHPVFGDARGGAPTLEEAFESGRALGEMMKEKSNGTL